MSVIRKVNLFIILLLTYNVFADGYNGNNVCHGCGKNHITCNSHTYALGYGDDDDGDDIMQFIPLIAAF